MSDKNKKEMHIIEFDLQNVIRIRLLNPSEKDVSTVANQLGLVPGIFDKISKPDITISFKEKIETDRLTLLGVDSSGFDNTNFFILNVGKLKAKVMVPFEQVGDYITITCESGLRHIPLLNHIINFRLIAKGFIPIHASAFVYNDIGILVPGWKTGGKTEALLSFATNGAKYVSDEWVVLSSDGNRMFGIPGPTSIKDWQFKYVKNLVPHIPVKNRMMFKSIHSLDNMYNVLKKGRLKSNFIIKILGDMLPSFKRQLKIWALPRKLFKDQFCSEPVSVDKIFLILMHSEDKIIIEDIQSSDVARSMIHTYDFEQKAFFEFYNAFKFAFPSKQNDFLETIKEREKDLLFSALDNKTAYKVYRPYPVSFPNLFDKMKSLCIKQHKYSLTG